MHGEFFLERSSRVEKGEELRFSFNNVEMGILRRGIGVSKNRHSDLSTFKCTYIVHPFLKERQNIDTKYRNIA